jgi:hypothetical protein
MSPDEICYLCSSGEIVRTKECPLHDPPLGHELEFLDVVNPLYDLQNPTTLALTDSISSPG